MTPPITRRQFIKSTTTGAAAIGLSAINCFSIGGCNSQNYTAGTKSRLKTERPNILWIVGENLKLDLGCYGAKNVHTPNLDALAADGMRYTHAFSTSPVCAPSRSAFFVLTETMIIASRKVSDQLRID